MYIYAFCCHLFICLHFHVQVSPYLDMELAVDSLPFVIHQFEGVTSISIHVLISVRNTAITEQEAHLMSGLRTQSNEIPEHIRILKITFEMTVFRHPN